MPEEQLSAIGRWSVTHAKRKVVNRSTEHVRQLSLFLAKANVSLHNSFVVGHWCVLTVDFVMLSALHRVPDNCHAASCAKPGIHGGAMHAKAYKLLLPDFEGRGMYAHRNHYGSSKPDPGTVFAREFRTGIRC